MFRIHYFIFKKVIVAVIGMGLMCAPAIAQEQAMRIHFANGSSQIHKISDVTEITFEEYQDLYAPEIPDDANPPQNGYIAQKMLEGELLYYGHDGENSPRGSVVYFLYLKDLNSSGRSASVCFYINVPRPEEGKANILPEGTYTAGSTWENFTFNTMQTGRYMSNWNVVDPKWAQYVASDGEFEVTVLNDGQYLIKGHMKGGSKQNDGTFLTNESGIAFSFTGPLKFEDYSDYYDTPEEPLNPPTPSADEITMTSGNLYYYGDNEYYLQLKDKQPTDTYEIVLYLNADPGANLELPAGAYTPSAGGEDMTFSTSKSSWTFIDHDFYDDRVRTNIASGDLTVESSGAHTYTIRGTFDSADKSSAIKIFYTGTLNFEDYSE